MEYDPKLKEAMAEIAAIMRKHDIGGYVQLVSQTHSEFRYELSPSWSAMQKIDGGVRFKVDTKEVGQAEGRKLAEETLHLAYQIRDLCARGFMDMSSLVDKAGEQVKVEHTPFAGFTPHREN